MQVSPVMSISKLCLDSDSNNSLRRWITTEYKPRKISFGVHLLWVLSSTVSFFPSFFF